MAFQDKKNEINWKVHFSSSIEKVYGFLTTDEGRKTFWAESAEEKNGIIYFEILNYPIYKGTVLESVYPSLFRIDYFGTEVTFSLHETSDSGTDLHLNAKVGNELQKYEMTPGWVSVLLAMKAAVDFGIDIRNHNPSRSWENGFADN